jgi:hypothetical protein
MLFNDYSELLRGFPAACSGLFGREVRSDIGLWLAVDNQGFPSFLLSMPPTDVRRDIELRFIGVQFSRECQIALSDGSAVGGTFTIIRLEENDPDLVRVFLRLLEEAFCGGDTPRTNRAVADQILELAELFRRVENSTKDLVGLFGELTIIAHCESREHAARCWSLHKNSKYDFVCGEFALEVKATLKARRDHRFSIDQLRPPSALDVYIASVQLTQAQGGQTIRDLIERILECLNDSNLRSAFLGLCIVKGGVDLYKSEEKLQLLSRSAGVGFYAAADIPAPIVPTGTSISNVRFDVCLDAIAPQVGEARARLANLAC